MRPEKHETAIFGKPSVQLACGPQGWGAKS